MQGSNIAFVDLHMLNIFGKDRPEEVIRTIFSMITMTTYYRDESELLDKIGPKSDFNKIVITLTNSPTTSQQYHLIIPKTLFMQCQFLLV